MKTLVFEDIESQPYIGDDESSEIESETIEESSLFEDEGKTLHSKEASCPSKLLYEDWVLLVWDVTIVSP